MLLFSVLLGAVLATWLLWRAFNWLCDREAEAQRLAMSRRAKGRQGHSRYDWE